MTDERTVEQFLLDHELAHYAVMFAQTGNGIFIWEAYRLCRQRKMPVREDILRQFDAMAERVMGASGAPEMLDAMLLRPAPGGGAQGAAAAAATQRRYRFAEVYSVLIGAGFSNSEAIRRTAERLCTSTGNVRKKLSELGVLSGAAKRTAKKRTPKISRALAALPVRRHLIR